MLRFRAGDLVKLSAEMRDCLPHLFGRPGSVVKVYYKCKNVPYRVAWDSPPEDYDRAGMPKTWGFNDDELELW